MKIQVLLDIGSAEGWSELRSDVAAARSLVDRQSFGDVSVRGHHTPLHTARNGEVVVALIERQADVHARTTFGVTPLHLACDALAAAALVEAGAAVNASAVNHRTPLHAAAARRYGSEEIATVLLDAGANPNAADKYRERPLHLAHDPGTTRLLVSRDAQINAADVRGRTALHAVAQASAMAERAARDARPEKPPRAEGLAAMRQSGKLFTGDAVQSQHLDLINTLLDLGAAIDCRTKDGDTAAHLACRLGARETAERLGATSEEFDELSVSASEKAAAEQAAREKAAAKKAAAERAAAQKAADQKAVAAAKARAEAQAKAKEKAEAEAKAKAKAEAEAEAKAKAKKAESAQKAYEVGEEVEVFSRSNNKWFVAKVTGVNAAGVDVTYSDAEGPLNKTLEPGSEHLRKLNAKQDGASKGGQKTAYKVGEQVEVFSRSNNKWFVAKVTGVSAAGVDVEYSDAEGPLNKTLEADSEHLRKLPSKPEAKKEAAQPAQPAKDEAKTPAATNESTRVVVDDDVALPTAESSEDGDIDRDVAELAHQACQAERIRENLELQRRTARLRGMPDLDWNAGLEHEPLQVFASQTFQIHGSGIITTQAYLWPSKQQMRGRHLFVDFEGGGLRVAILSESGAPVTPFTLSNCTPIRCNNGRENAFGEAVWWRSAGGIDGMDLSDLINTVGDGRSFGMRLQFEIDNGCLFGVYLAEAIPRTTDVSVPASMRNPEGRHLAFDVDGVTYTARVPEKCRAGDSFKAALPPRAARRGPSGHGIVLSAPLQEPSALAHWGMLPLPSMDIVRQLVGLGFKEPLSKRAAAMTAGGGIAAASKWAQAARGGTAAHLQAAPPPLAAGRWRLDSCLAPRNPNRSGHLVLVHTTELVELGLVEEGIGRVVGLCVRQGNNVGGKQPGISGAQGAGGPAAAPKAVATDKEGGIVCTARMGIDSVWYDWVCSFGDVFCRRYAAELGFPAFTGPDLLQPSVQIEYHPTSEDGTGGSAVVLEVGDEVLVKIRLHKLPGIREWPGGAPGKENRIQWSNPGEDGRVDDASTAPALSEGWLGQEEDTPAKLTVWSPFFDGRSFTSKGAGRTTPGTTASAAEDVAADAVAMGVTGPSGATPSTEMPSSSVCADVRAAQSCTALVAGEYHWGARGAGTSGRGSWLVRVLEDGRLELRYGASDAPAWGATFGVLLSPDGDVRFVDGDGRVDSLHSVSAESALQSKADAVQISPSVAGGLAQQSTGSNTAAVAKELAALSSALAKATKPASKAKPKPKPKPAPKAKAPTYARRSARAISEKLAHEKAALETAKAAVAFFSLGAKRHTGVQEEGPAGVQGVDSRSRGGAGGGLRELIQGHQEDRSAPFRWG